jgi:hypothetical protein
MKEDLQMDDDALLDELAGLDPVGGDAPPARGSARYHSILETAMTTTLDHHPHHLDGMPQLRRSRRLPILAAVAAAAVFVAGAVVFRPGSEPSAFASVQQAAEAMASVDSLRAEVVRYDPSGEFVDRALADVSGADVAVSLDFGDGEPVPSFAAIGDTIFEVLDGVVESRPRSDNDALAPFADASSAVVEAALTGATVDDVGREEVRDTESVHYRVELTDAGRSALAALTAQELAWFELEYPNEVSAVDVWVADGLVRRIRVGNLDGSAAVTEFWDLGADITVVVPTIG